MKNLKNLTAYIMLSFVTAVTNLAPAFAAGGADGGGAATHVSRMREAIQIAQYLMQQNPNLQLNSKIDSEYAKHRVSWMQSLSRVVISPVQTELFDKDSRLKRAALAIYSQPFLVQISEPYFDEYNVTPFQAIILAIHEAGHHVPGLSLSHEELDKVGEVLVSRLELTNYISLTGEMVNVVKKSLNQELQNIFGREISCGIGVKAEACLQATQQLLSFLRHEQSLNKFRKVFSVVQNIQIEEKSSWLEDSDRFRKTHPIAVVNLSANEIRSTESISVALENISKILDIEKTIEQRMKIENVELSFFERDFNHIYTDLSALLEAFETNSEFATEVAKANFKKLDFGNNHFKANWKIGPYSAVIGPEQLKDVSALTQSFKTYNKWRAGSTELKNQTNASVWCRFAKIESCIEGVDFFLANDNFVNDLKDLATSVGIDASKTLNIEMNAHKEFSISFKFCEFKFPLVVKAKAELKKQIDATNKKCQSESNDAQQSIAKGEAIAKEISTLLNKNELTIKIYCMGMPAKCADFLKLVKSDAELKEMITAYPNRSFSIFDEPREHTDPTTVEVDMRLLDKVSALKASLKRQIEHYKLYHEVNAVTGLTVECRLSNAVACQAGLQNFLNLYQGSKQMRQVIKNYKEHVNWDRSGGVRINGMDRSIPVEAGFLEISTETLAAGNIDQIEKLFAEHLLLW